jgi:hypothetical protein
MSAMAERDAYRLLAPRHSLLAALARQRGLLLAFMVGFPMAFYLGLLGLLAVRFGHLPNYAFGFNWPKNVMHIVASTSSIADMVPIILNEWVLEIGYMNYDYGRGVSEWSLAIIPHKVAMVALIGGLVGFNFILLCEQEQAGTMLQQSLRSIRTGLMTALGALCASLTCITLYWVVCHSGPTWVVSLAILGIDVSTAYALEPIGPAVSLFGVALLAVSIVLVVRDGKTASNRAKGGAVRC